ncbi:MAG: cell division protein ZapA [Candidatus Rokubacteria bacterium]|nr:cell division protein ZapA [Candidatus Rokubacteria bacterium]
MDAGRAEIEILGQRYTVRGEASPDYIRQMAAYLEGKIQELRRGAGVKEPMRLSVLAGLHIVDELFRAREDQDQVAGRVDALIALLERTVSG